MRKHRKTVITLMVFIFIFNLLPISVIKAGENVNIISNTSILVQEAKNWAKSKGATDTFISLADLYWKYAPEHGGVNPALAYAQAAKETGYGKFGGIINETFHNPCGLKTTLGGADNDPAAHKVFSNWDEGVQAHLDHLALYAGASGYPRQSTYDPRHFSTIIGKAKTVTELGGGWAPSATYGLEVLELYNQANSISVNSKNYGVIEGYTVGAHSITVNGWGLNPNGVKEIQIFLDGEFKGNAQYGLSRPDVQQSYLGYNNADKSGYTGTVDISSLPSGNKTLEIRQVGNDGTIYVLAKSVNIIRKASILSIDLPTSNSKVNGNTLYLTGWALTGSGVKAVNIYVDGKLKGKANYGGLRPDVNAVYPGYTDGSKSGFSATVDITDIAGGSKLVVAELVGNDGSVAKTQTSIYVNKPIPVANLEDCKVLSNNQLYIRGWAINPMGVKEVQIYVDGQFKGNAQYGISRPDVQAAFKGYPYADKSGFNTTIDVSTIATGNKIVEVKYIGNDGSNQSTVTKVNISRKPSGINIDSPVMSSRIYGNTLSVAGWALNDSGVKEINVYIDGKLKGKASYGGLRPDVNAVYPGYTDGGKSGFLAIVDITDIVGGSRLVVVELVGNDGSLAKTQTSIYVDKPVPAANLENAELLSNNKLYLRGWAINPKGIKQVQIYVDGKYKGNAQYGISRPDVQAAFKGYPYAGQSGFIATVDVSDIAVGSKNIKIKSIGNDDSENYINSNITISRKAPGINIDIPTSNSKVTGDTLFLAGWALNDSGVKEVNIYIDGKLKGKANYGGLRPDVNAVYPGYIDGVKSGFSATVDVADVAVGSRLVVAELVGNDGSIAKTQTSIYVNKALPASNLEESKLLSGNKLYIRGWAINPKGIKQVQIYVDGKYKGNAQYGISRPDVQEAFKGYPYAGQSGFIATVDVSDITVGSKTIQIKSIGNDASENSIDSNIMIVRKTAAINIDVPTTNSKVNGDTLFLAGWALNDSGVKAINIYVDGILKGKATYGDLRVDVNTAYPGYPDGSKCGFSASVNVSDVSGGSKTVVAELVGNDGSSTKKQTEIYINKPLPVANLEEATLMSGNKLYLRGWAIDPIGIKEVQIYIDGKYKGNAQYGISRPDVQAAFKGYPYAGQSGFTATVDVSDIPVGSRSIEIKRVGNNGETHILTSTANIVRKSAIISIDTPSVSYLESKDSLQIAGWAINDTGIKVVDVYVDSVLKKTVTASIGRPDVKAAYPSYADGVNNGFNTSLNISQMSIGKHVLRLDVIGIDGSVNSIERTFYYKEKRLLIVVDPGHNYGGDYGASSTHDGVKYSETEMNMPVALKLQIALQAQGYSVILTRNPLDRSTLDATTSLHNRARLANDLNADLFISIHHNSGGSSARGSEVYYTQRTTPDDGFPAQSADKISRSIDLAKATANNMSASTGFINRGSLGDVGTLGYSLSVLRNTKMPAILVECGFISNPTEASLLVRPEYQQATANAIAAAVQSRF